MKPMGPLLEPVYLAGPTAVGKSEIAAEVAARLNGEIVGADAFQLYRGLDLLTAKPDAATRARVPHHLIGEIPLVESFDVARYHAMATERIREIVGRGKRPVVVGGTGLYFRALTHGLAELPPPDDAVRADLSSKPLAELLAKLEELDPQAAMQIDRQNPRRVIRALEVCLATGRPFSSFREQWKSTPDVRAVFLNRERDELYARIDRRTLAMFAAGVVDEVKGVSEIGPTASQAIGFREIRELLAGQIMEPQCIAQIQQQTRNYAKRQVTWFRKESHFATVMLGDAESIGSAADRVWEALKR